MFAINSVGDFCGVENVFPEESIGMSNFRFLGGVIEGGNLDFPLQTFDTRLLLVNCCFFCRIVSARVSTFRILAARFSNEYGEGLGVEVGGFAVS